MDLTETYGTDPKKKNEGVWVDVAIGAKIKVARLNNPVYKEEYQKLTQGIRSVESLTETTKIELLCKAMAHGVLIDWKGIDYKGKKNVSYSKELALEILLDPTLEDFRDLVTSEAQSIENFRIDQLNEDSEK